MAGPSLPTFPLPDRVARLDLQARTWWRAGLERPWTLPSVRDAALVPTLGAQPVIAHLDQSCALVPGEEITLTLAWPVVWTLRIDGVLLDTFRPDMREAVLGPLDEGRILPAAPCARLAGPPPASHAALTVVMRPAADGASVVRRIAFDERGLTLARHDGHLLAGEVVLSVHQSDHASSACRAPSLPPGAEVLRPGSSAAQDLPASGLRWWIDGTRRSMGFGL